MGRGVDFFDGMDAANINYGSTQPEQPKQSAGPVVGPMGVDDWQAHSNTSNDQAMGGNPGGIGSKFVSPTDK